MTSCLQSGNDPAHHFAGAGKMIALGKGGVREVSDYQLSRFACYLITQNGDSRKPQIAFAQKYFAIQTRRQELYDEQVGKEVREAIKRIGGTMPESIPPAEPIKQVEKRLKAATPKLALEAKDAAGLIRKGEEPTNENHP